MPPRFAPALVASLALIIVAGCAGAAPSAVAPSATPVAQAPDPTPLPVAERTPAPEPVATPATDDTGGVDGAKDGPELVIESVDDDTIRATLGDPEAKAWRLVIAGTGELGADRWEIAVETGDVTPIVTATEIRGGEVVDVLDLSGFADGTAAVGGCHSTLPVCLDSDGFRLPDGGDGLFSVRLDLPEAQVALVIRGSTAAWGGEPFVLGDWRDTEPFPWGEG
ncbi:MAG TPA: hypothetical protein VES19_04205 [Candidatus Limnocylindrales bacterium]|nr:hypothetical protein [Candidatus Limnocylindrales bacterium]